MHSLLCTTCRKRNKLLCFRHKQKHRYLLNELAYCVKLNRKEPSLSVNNIGAHVLRKKIGIIFLLSSKMSFESRFNLILSLNGLSFTKKKWTNQRQRRQRRRRHLFNRINSNFSSKIESLRPNSKISRPKSFFFFWLLQRFNFFRFEMDPSCPPFVRSISSFFLCKRNVQRERRLLPVMNNLCWCPKLAFGRSQNQ